MVSDDTWSFVVKIETDSIDASVVTTGVLLDVDRHYILKFSNRPCTTPIQEMVLILEATAPGLVIVQTMYPLKILHRLYGLEIDEERVVDVFALAKVFRKGGNGLEAWARQFGGVRSKFLGSPVWTPAAQMHCERDAVLIHHIYEHLSAQVQV